MKKAYIVNEKTKTITVDPTVKMSSADEKTIERYVKLGGYTYREKSKARVESAQKKSNNLTANDIRERLKDDAEALKMFESINKGTENNGDGKKGFFAARKWFMTEYKGSDSKPATKAKSRSTSK